MALRGYLHIIILQLLVSCNEIGFVLDAFTQSLAY